MLHMTRDRLLELDEEWLQLILEARDLGLTPEQIRNFLKSVSSADTAD